MKELKNDVFNNYSLYYDELNGVKDYAKEVAYLVTKLEQFNCRTQKLLELGSGTGKHAIELIKKGFHVDAIELSQDMIDVGLVSKKYRPHQGDIKTFKLDHKYDLAISLYHVVSYLTTDSDVTKALRNVRNHLSSGGLFLFDVWHTAGVYSQRPSMRIRTASIKEGKCIRVANSFVDLKNNTVKVVYDFDILERDGVYKCFSEEHIMRHFSFSEIQRFATKSNFEVIHSEDFLTETPLSLDTWGAFFILKAI